MAHKIWIPRNLQSSVLLFHLELGHYLEQPETLVEFNLNHITNILHLVLCEIPLAGHKCCHPTRHRLLLSFPVVLALAMRVPGILDLYSQTIFVSSQQSVIQDTNQFSHLVMGLLSESLIHANIPGSTHILFSVIFCFLQ